MFVTYFYEFRIYKSTNPQICFNKNVLFYFKRKQQKILEKNCGFVDSEFLKTCTNILIDVKTKATFVYNYIPVALNMLA